MEFPAAVIELRSALGLTQQQLADRLPVHVLTLQRWESGSFKPRPAALVGLYRLAQQANRPDLAAAFVRGSSVVLDQTASDLIVDVLPHVLDYFVTASSKLAQSLFDPKISIDQRRQLTAEATEILVEGQRFVNRIMQDVLTTP
jgi:transcriptional regulator with XRE-family HTH domain